MGSDITPESPQAGSGRPEDALARRLIWIRNFRELTQRKAAELAGISKSTVNDAESGQVEITLRTVRLLAQAYVINQGVLLGCMPLPEEILLEDAKRRRF
jgi:transcriptional regulator with XRE-family HTH domain